MLSGKYCKQRRTQCETGIYSQCNAVRNNSLVAFQTIAGIVKMQDAREAFGLKCMNRSIGGDPLIQHILETMASQYLHLGSETLGNTGSLSRRNCKLHANMIPVTGL